MSKRIAWIVVMGAAWVGAAAAQDAGGPIDWQKARQLRQKQRRGEELTKDEKEYLDRALKARRQQRGAGARLSPRESTGLVPLTDLGNGKYKGEDGGLYGGGRNTPPAGHLASARKALAKIRPLDARGRPSPGGKIVLMSVGMSNTTQEYSTFMRLASRDPAKSPAVVLVDGARGGMDVSKWIHARRGGADGGGRRGVDIWAHVAERLRAAGVTPEQVQAVWIKQAKARPAEWGEYPAHGERLKSELGELCRALKSRFANIRVIYLSSRIYAGYATGQLNPEPYAYESALAVRGLIQDQINGDKKLNHDPAAGEVVAPILLWGPYLWADGVKGRKIDDLVYERRDLAGDGTHPSSSGRMKVARQLLKFFKTDPLARMWFAGPPGPTSRRAGAAGSSRGPGADRPGAE